MSKGNDYDGLLVAVEGIDGAGKSTVVEALGDVVEEMGGEPVLTKEPTDMWTGEQVYRALKDDDMPAVADFSMFVADRVKHVEQRIEPALKEGKVVITDRYADSTRAYQTHRVADEMGLTYQEARRWMEGVFEPWNVEPDLTIYIDIPVDVAMERCGHEDKYERRENLVQVRDAYETMYDSCDPGVRILDGTQSKIAVRKRAANSIRAQLYEPTSYDGKTYAEAVEE